MKYISILLLLAAALPAAATPRLVCAEPIHDFGRVKGEPVISHSFALENRGDSSLVVRRVVTSCGCTTPDARSFTIAPGDTRNLPIKFDLHGRSGKQRQFVTLHTNDPDTPRLALQIMGNAVPPVDISPRTLNLKQVDPDNLDAHARTITLTSTSEEPFKVEKVEALNQRARAVVTHAEDGRSATVEVTPLPQTGEGNFTDILMIHTSNPDVRGKRVLVMWEVRTGISVAPGVMKLRMLPGAPVQQRYMMVRAPSDLQTDLEITDVTWEDRDLEIDWTSLPMGWRIHIKDLVAEEDMHGDTIRIQTNHPKTKELTVPVRVVR